MPALSLVTERVVRAAVADVRRQVIDELVRQGFTIETSPSTGIVAHRGSALTSVYGPTPLRAVAALVGDGAATRVHVTVSETSAWTNPIRARDPLGAPLVAVQQGVDGALALLDPAAASAWGEVTVPVADHAPQTASGGSSGGVRSALTALPSLPGGFRVPGLTAAPAGGVELIAPDGVARLSTEESRTHLAVATMITNAPGALPDALAGDLADAALAMTRALAAPVPPWTRLEVTARQKPAWAFVHQQVLIRAALPMREVHRCRECRFEKVVNPDYTRMVRRKKLWQGLSGVGGLAISSSGNVNMFVLANRVLNLKQLDPDWVCPRCQGMGCDVTTACICPGCGQIVKAPVLRTCPGKGCGFAFFSAVDDPVPLWQALPAAPPAEPAEAPATALPASPAAAPPVLDRAIEPPTDDAAPSAVAVPGPPPVPVARIEPPAPPHRSLPPPTGQPFPAQQPAQRPAQQPATEAAGVAGPAEATPPPMPPVPRMGTAPQAAPMPPPPPPPTARVPMSPPAWHPDPTRRHALRYFDGWQWTSWVSDGGPVLHDPAVPDADGQ